MLTRRIIPCLDVSGGRVVKGIRFASLRDAGDPVVQASSYQDQGADELVILDVSATLEGRVATLETISAVREILSIPLTVGGGVRSVADAEALLSAGADKVAVNTAAFERPEIISELTARNGAQCVVVAIDAARKSNQRWEVVIRAGSERTGVDVFDWARACSERGAGEILLTSWDRDGTGDGYDLDLLSMMSEATSLPIIASGGANGAEHMESAFEAGADAVLAASIFHDGKFTVREIKEVLQERGVEVRS